MHPWPSQPTGILARSSLFLVLLITAKAAPPANDHFASRAALSTGVAATSTTTEATLEASEPIPGWLTPRYQRSVWWKWTAPASGWYQATTSGSAADTILTVSSGAALNALTLIQANDQDLRANAGLSSEQLHNYELPNARVLFEAVAGTEYQLAVASANADAGAVRLKVESSAPPSPRVTSLSITPSPVDAGNPTTPRGTMTLGISSQTPFLRGNLILYSRANDYRARVAGFSPTNRISGDALNGTYSIPFSPHLRSPAGTMDFQLILEADLDREMSSYGLRGQSPLPGAATSSFPVINSGTPDTTPPVIESVSFTNSSMNITSAWGSTVGSVRATDLGTTAAGMKIVMGSLIDESGREFYRTGQSSRASGNANDGVYSLFFDFPFYHRTGNFTVRVWAEDAAGNVSTPVTSGQAGFPGPFTGPLQITRTTNATLTSFTITPPVVDVTQQDQTVVFEAISPQSSTGSTFTIWPPMAGDPLFNTFAPELFRSSSDSGVVAIPGGWRATFVIPRGYPPGQTTLGLQFTQGSSATYFGPRFNLPFPAGTPQGLIVINDAVPDLRAPKVEFTDIADEPKMRVACPQDGTWTKIRVTDDSTGLPETQAASIGLRRSDFSVLGFRTSMNNAQHRIRGDALDSTFRAFMLASTSAGSVLSSGDYVLEAVARDRMGRQATVTRTRPFKIVTAGSAYTTWAEQYFIPSNPCNSLDLWSPYADPDKDRLHNLLEAYFGSHPSVLGPRRPPVDAVSDGAEITAVWIEPANTNGVAVVPQWSPDLVAWMISGEGLRSWPARTLTVETVGPASGGGTIKQVRMNRAGLEKAWLRLQAVPGP